MSELKATDFPTTLEEKQAMLDQVLADQLPQYSPQEHPKLSYIVGQPASGKTSTIESLKFQAPGVEIDSDTLRALHPRMGEIFRADPLRMDVLSNEPVGFLFSNLLQEYKSHHFNIYLENTMTNTAAIRSTVEDFSSDGYLVEVHLIATPAPVSRLAIATRYFGQLHAADDSDIDSNYPRWTSVFAHDNAFNKIPEAIRRLDGIPDVLQVWENGVVVYKGQDVNQATDILTKLRDKPLSAEVRELYSAKFAAIQREFRALANNNAPVHKLYESVILDAKKLGISFSDSPVSSNKNEFRNRAALTDFLPPLTAQALKHQARSSKDDCAPANHHRTLQRKPSRHL